MAIEMTIVMPPFVVDFASASLDVSIEFSEEIWADWERTKQEQFRLQWETVSLSLSQSHCTEVRRLVTPVAKRSVLLCSNIANLKPLWSEMNGCRSDKTTPEDCRLLEKRLRRFGPYTADDGHVVRRTFSRRFTVLCFAFRWLDDAFLEAHEQHVRIVAARPLHYLCY
jgi:hypothetical protein